MFTAFLRDDVVFVLPSPWSSRRPVAIMQGRDCRPVLRAESLAEVWAAAESAKFCGRIPLLGDRARVAVLGGKQFAGFPDLTALMPLDPADTLFASLPSYDQSVVVWLVEDLSISAHVDGDWEFTALLGCYGGNGELQLIWKQGVGKHIRHIPFEQNPAPSRKTRRLKFIRERIRLGRGEVSFSLKLKHYGRQQGTVDSPLFGYLLSGPSLSPPPRVNELTQGPIARVAGSSILNVNDGQAYAASVIPFASAEDQPISVQWDDGAIEQLFLPLAEDVSLVEDHGYIIIVRVCNPALYGLFINKKFGALLNLRSGLNTIHLPVEWLRGEPVLVEIRDASGGQIFLCHTVFAPRFLTPADLFLQQTKRPFPTDLTCRAKHRYQALRAHLRNPIPGITQDALLQALETLDADYASLKLKPLSFPDVAKPDVSVVIPAHNKVEATYYALSALLLAHNTTSFEVILVDDGSTDETAEIEQLVSGIRVVRNAEPLRFIKACNKGVSEARGTFVALLNNDTEVTLGWLDALVDVFQRFDGVGAVGSKLLFPDGTLQDAGGIIWGSGNPWNYGSTQNPWDPRFCYTRQVDYLSGAALMTTKAIWDEVGGLSHYLEPMYFEDTDFSFKIREAGYKTYFVPSSVVYHFEGTTSGTDTSSGFKKYQEVNRPKFKRRWAKAFAGHGKEGINPDLEKDRGISGRILFIDYTIPRGDRDAGSYAAIREIELVQALGYKVTFLPQNLGFFGNYTEELQRMGVEVISAPFYLSMAAFLKQRAQEFDLAYITRYYVAADAVDPIRKYSPSTRIILNNADLHFLRELRAAINDGEKAKSLAIRKIRKKRDHELAMMRRVDLVLSYNEVEHAVISSHTDGAVKVMTCPWVVDIPETVAPLAGRAGISFLGSFKHPPNTEGVRWFCQEVMPQLEALQLKLSIYGSGMDDDIKSLSSDWIDPVGYIEDVADAYQRHRVFVAPLLSGAGIKGKVLNALAYGIPTVLTPTAAEGIGLRHGHDCLIARTPDEWVDGITKLSNDDDLWITISHAARSYAADHYSFAVGKKKMKAAFEAVDLYFHCDE